MSTPRQLGIVAARPFIERAAETLPADVVFAFDVGGMVDAVLAAAHPDALIPPRHRVEDEDDLAYQVAEPRGEDPRALYAFLTTWPGKPATGHPGRLDVTVVRAYTASTARVDTNEVVTLGGHPQNMRLFGMGLVAAADHVTAERVRAEVADPTPTEN